MILSTVMNTMCHPKTQRHAASLSFKQRKKKKTKQTTIDYQGSTEKLKFCLKFKSVIFLSLIMINS